MISEMQNLSRYQVFLEGSLSIANYHNASRETC